MKKIYTVFLLSFALGLSFSFAQAPLAIPYQAVARDNFGNAVANQTVSLRFSVHDSSATGTVVYRETQSAITNTLGLFTVNIGQGTVVSGSFAAISWGTGTKFMQVEMDVTGGTSYVSMGTQQMLSVPYALYAGNLPNGSSDGQILVWNAATSQWVATSICSLFNSSANCGSCGHVCGPYANATAGCSSGVCMITSCTTGFADCNSVVADGCEINLTSDVNNCGLCGHICALANAVPGCSSSACLIISCNTGFKNCDGTTSNGCEININTDVLNCSACGIVCSTNNITRTCSAGSCSGVCNSGFADCNNNKQADGCEININTDFSNCGACGNSCSSNHMATITCTSGSCSGSCASGFADCNNNRLTDGCEISITTDLSNCGSCGLVCSNNNMASRTCSAGLCTGTCTTGFANCNGNFQIDGCELNIFSDPNNCGACGSVCSSNNISAACSSGSCSGSCTSGFADCDGNKRTNGCEISINTDISNCGACGSICSSNNIATRICSAGACTGNCNAGFADCNGSKLTDGCEINTTNNASNCGSCGHACASGHSCIASICN